MSRQDSIALTWAPVRVTGASKEPLRLAHDVTPYAALDLELQVLEGSNIEVRLITSMQNDNDVDGWIEVDRFVPTSANGAEKRCFFPLLQYARWEVLTAAASTFLIHGVGRRRLAFLPTDLDGCILWLRSDLSVTLSSGSVSSWGDRSPMAHHATQSTSSARPGYNSKGWSNGLPTVDFDGVNHWMSLTSLIDGSKDGTLFAALDQRNETAEPQHLIDTVIGAYTPVTRTSAGVGIFDSGSWTATGAEQNGEQILTWALDLKSSLFECFRNGASIGTNSYGAFDLNAPELGRISGGGGELDAEVAEVILYNRVLSAPELSLVHGYLKVRYGL